MDINELESFNLSDAVKFHNNLNPALWTEKGKLDPEVKAQLMIIAKDFISELGINSTKVEDITISGSNAAYTYTPHSDLDLHILVDFTKLPDDNVYQELFKAKKTLYNDNHDIKVHGVPVELYVQDSNEPVVSLGEYSLLKNEWIKYPKKNKANFNQNATRAKYEQLGELIEIALKTKDLKKVEKALDIVKRYRKAGLDRTGEFGPENLAFKALRKQGYIEKLWDLKNELHSRELSIEDYHPNATPPGPEFPPTMPMGTIRVDVSDVYDWYKLGQHISNMKGLGKHDFGKGPPSTILSFGDEDLEHKYIDALNKTGLDVTDIDPKGHEPKKGIKTDPTYNVNESVKFIEGTNCKNCLAWKKGSEKPVGKDELNKYGGLKPPNKEYIAMSKRVDLVTLPGKDTVKVKGFCELEDVNDWVTERMCCAKWDGKGVIRDYKGESPLMEENLEEASGYIPSEKEKNDPRFKTALTVDVKPDSIKKNAKAFNSKVSRAGIPPQARTDGKIK